MTLNYFVCTLGQAVLPEISRGHWKTINDLVDFQHEQNPELPAVGFAYPASDNRQGELGLVKLYSFHQVHDGSFQASRLLRENTESLGVPSQSTIALLSPSTPDFLFTWLALIRLGHPVMLIAPQNQAEAIAHLCKSHNVHTLVYDKMYEDLARDSVTEVGTIQQENLHLLQIPFSSDEESFEIISNNENKPSVTCVPNSPADTAYLFHTSGTSSGLPKPIPQTHHGAIGVLPNLAGGRSCATFSTTPLYHGGIADLFRAWTSDALIWLYPGKDAYPSSKPLPITAPNILSCLQAINSQHKNTPPIRYFSSVPYVLQMMASDPEGLRLLQTMDCVGVGGAALPAAIGDKLVAQDVNLVSRYGSAECGFLLSSHRNYSLDREWVYLRANEGVECLKFESHGDNKYELVVKSGWPHMAKTNRPNGSYATSDLFTPHPTIPDAWRYDTRADSQLTLITGKKFDPAPLEGAIGSSPLVEDAFVFGNGQPFPGALLFRSEQGRALDDDEFIAKLAPFIEDLNARSQSHARIPRNMLIPIAYNANRLQKSSKGTILRGKAEETYSEIISSAYKHLSAPTKTEVPDSDVERAIHQSVHTITNQDIPVDEDLFSHGVDSLGSIQIRYFLQRLLPHQSNLPMSVVEDCGNISKLANLLIRARQGDMTLTGSDAELDLMRDLVEKYSNFPSPTYTKSPTIETPPPPTSKRDTIILTGATGGLGAHLLSQYRHSARIHKIYCLVRDADSHAAHERIDKSLQSRKLPPLSSPTDNEVTILPCKFGEPNLGLSSEDYDNLAAEATHVVHAAWAVNFRWRLRSFERDHIAGTKHLLDLCLCSRRGKKPVFAFCSSVASVSAMSSTGGDHVSVRETPSTSPSDASPLGYSRSKWVAEAICARAAAVHPGFPVKVLRIGQLAGDSAHGIWNNAEAWPLMLGSMRATGVLPDLKGQALDWLAVDVAARAVGQVVEGFEDGEKGRVGVFHIVNTDRGVTWGDALRWLKGFGEHFEAVEPGVWVRSLEQLDERVEGRGHPALRLLGLWREKYVEGEDAEAAGVRFDAERAKDVADALKNVKAVDEEYFQKLWDWTKVNAVG